MDFSFNGGYGGGSGFFAPSGGNYGGGVTLSGGPSVGTGGGGGWWSDNNSTVGNVANIGLNLTDTILGYKVMQNQVNHNQTPTISFNAAGQPVGIPQGLNTGLASIFSNGWMLYLIVAIVLILLFKK